MLISAHIYINCSSPVLHPCELKCQLICGDHSTGKGVVLNFYILSAKCTLCIHYVRNYELFQLSVIIKYKVKSMELVHLRKHLM